MSVIVYNHVERTMAADRMMIQQGRGIEVTKIYQLSDGSIAGFAGNMILAMQMLDWLKNGAAPKSFPVKQFDREHYVTIVHVRYVPTNDDVTSWVPEIRMYENDPTPVIVHNQHIAIGTGGELAKGALLTGASAIHAVELACMHDPWCGTFGKLPDVLTLTNNHADAAAAIHEAATSEQPPKTQ